MSSRKKYKVAIVGATGLVGNEIREILGSRKFPVQKLKLLASQESIGEIYEFNGEAVPVTELEEDSFIDVDLAFFATNSSLSKRRPGSRNSRTARRNGVRRTAPRYPHSFLVPCRNRCTARQTW